MFESVAKTNTTHTAGRALRADSRLRVLLKQIQPTLDKRIQGRVGCLRVLLKQIQPTHENMITNLINV